jgi:hypothetical protein
VTAVLAADRRAAARIALALIAIAAVTGSAVHLIAAAPARHALGFGFGGIPREPGEAVSIFVNNARMLLALLAACLVSQASYLGGVSRDEPIAVVARTACDVVVVAVAAGHALLVGSAVGAYGGRMIVALLPHGPLELAAFALPLALYAAARRERLTARHWLATTAAAAAGLFVAAVAEVLLAP